jgi:hypothetical protein
VGVSLQAHLSMHLCININLGMFFCPLCLACQVGMQGVEFSLEQINLSFFVLQVEQLNNVL